MNQTPTIDTAIFSTTYNVVACPVSLTRRFYRHFSYASGTIEI